MDVCIQVCLDIATFWNLSFFNFLLSYSDGEGDLWDSTEGARELLQGYIKRNSLPLPELDTGDAGKEAGAAPTGSAARKAGTSGDKNAEDADDAFVLARMFMTAIDMLLEEEE